jgi:AhpD family alkylhydroperoxidase
LRSVWGMTSFTVNLLKAQPDTYSALDAFSDSVDEACAANGIDDRLKELTTVYTSQLNGCAYCNRAHADDAIAAGVEPDTLLQLATWRESGVFSERERVALEIAEAFVHIPSGAISDDLGRRALAVFTEKEFAALSWLCVAYNAINRAIVVSGLRVAPRSA